MLDERNSINQNVTIFVADDDEKYLKLFGIACSEFGLPDTVLCSGEHVFTESLNARDKTLDRAIFFLDIRMERPDSGLHLAKAIKRNPVLRYFPTIVMSSSMLQHDVNRAMNTGANSCFYKPTGSIERVEAIKQHLSYWTKYSLLTSLKFGFEDGYYGDNPDKSNDGEYHRTAALHSIDLLRRDILVSILRDLDRLSAINIPLHLKDIIDRTVSRLLELFEFRINEFGPEAYQELSEFQKKMKSWVRAGEFANSSDENSINRCLDERRNLMSELKKSRSRFSVILKDRNYFYSSTSSAHPQDITRMSFLIWDIFFEISKDSNFKDLYRSMRRFETSIIKNRAASR